jgi:DNA-binding IclR family transcriptional regulator
VKREKKGADQPKRIEPDGSALTEGSDGEGSSSATARSLAILAQVADASEPLTASQIAPRLGLPVPTVHRLARHLEELGYLERVLGSKRLSVGPALQSLALRALINSDIRGERHGVLVALVAEVKETCNVTVLDGNEVVYIDRVESQWPLRTHLQPGSRVPIHCGASGKVFLAHMPAYRRRRFLYSAPLRRVTEKTVIDPAQIEEELKEVRASGCAVDDEGFLAGLVGLAVPIFDHAGRVCATVSMHSPTIRHSVDAILQHAPALQRTAMTLQSELVPDS